MTAKSMAEIRHTDKAGQGRSHTHSGDITKQTQLSILDVTVPSFSSYEATDIKMMYDILRVAYLCK